MKFGSPADLTSGSTPFFSQLQSLGELLSVGIFNCKKEMIILSHGAIYKDKGNNLWWELPSP